MEPWQGLRILVTGATNGIGAQLVGTLARDGAHVIAHGRSEAKLAAIESAQKTCADLASLAEVTKLARELAPIDVLINNAGIGFCADRTQRDTSRDGFELRFAVNYLAPFLLSETLLARSAVSRAIINVASIGQAALDLSDLQCERRYDGYLAYRRSKLALIMHTRDLADTHAALAINSLHPGTLLDTGMVREAGLAPLGPVSRGVDAIRHVLRESLTRKTSGVYFNEMEPARADPQADDATVRAALRAKTLALLSPGD